MVNINIDGCECVCRAADIVKDVSEQSQFHKSLEIGLVVLVIILVILGLIIGIRKLLKKD